MDREVSWISKEDMVSRVPSRARAKMNGLGRQDIKARVSKDGIISQVLSRSRASKRILRSDNGARVS